MTTLVTNPMKLLTEDNDPGRPTVNTLLRAQEGTNDQMPYGEAKKILAARERMERWMEKAAVAAVTEDLMGGNPREYGRTWRQICRMTNSGTYRNGEISISISQAHDRGPDTPVCTKIYKKSELRKRYLQA